MTPCGAGGRRAPESGAAVVEFVLVSVLVLALLLGVAQLALALHVRNTLETAAADGARYGAADGRSPADAAARARAVAASALRPSLVGDVRASRENVDGLATVRVDVRARLPVIGVWGPSGVLHVRAHALDETP